MSIKRLLNSKIISRYDLDLEFGNVLGNQNEKRDYTEDIEEDVFEDKKDEYYEII